VAGHGTGKLNTDELKAFNVAVPKPAEQELIADCIFGFEPLVTAQTQKLNALNDHKKGLMQQLFPSLDEAKG
jgi:type I restriction enzyme S subunit